MLSPALSPFRPALCAAAFVLGGAAPSPPQEPLDFVKVGTEMLTRHGFDAGATGTDVFYDVMERACARIEIGPLTLYLPKEAFLQPEGRRSAAPPAVDALKLAIPATLRAAIQVAVWNGAPAPTAKQLADLEKGIGVPAGFDPARLDQPLPWTAFLTDPKDRKIAAAVEAAYAALGSPGSMPPGEGERRPPLPLAVFPDRRSMVEYLCLAGVAKPALASAFHTPAITGWMHSYYGSADHRGRVQMLCLEEGSVGDGALNTWTEPSQDTDPELARHILTYDSLVALVGARAPSAPSWFTLGMAFEGVFAQYGRIGARLGADSVGDVTPPRQAFVPGGRSQGGQFPQNVSSLRGTIGAGELLDFLEGRKQAAFKLLEDRDAKDPLRKAARSGDEVVFFNFRDDAGSEEHGHLHFGPYLGTDQSHLIGRGVGGDLSLTQRALFALVAGKLAARNKGAAVQKLFAALPAAGDFEAAFREQVGVTPGDLERELFEGIKKK